MHPTYEGRTIGPHATSALADFVSGSGDGWMARASDAVSAQAAGGAVDRGPLGIPPFPDLRRACQARRPRPARRGAGAGRPPAALLPPDPRGTRGARSLA